QGLALSQQSRLSVLFAAVAGGGATGHVSGYCDLVAGPNVWMTAGLDDCRSIKQPLISSIFNNQEITMSHMPSPSQAGQVSYHVLVQGNCLGFTGGFLGLSSVVLVRIDGVAPILFDTGHHATKAMLIRALAEQGLAPNDVGKVFLSHLHFDHANNVDLFPHAELIVSREEWAYAQHPAREDIYISVPVIEHIGR